MSKKESLTKRMWKLGMAWAVTSAKTVLPEDGWGAKPAYHIHPDRSYPHQSNILRFYTLRELEEYIVARERAAAKEGK